MNPEQPYFTTSFVRREKGADGEWKELETVFLIQMLFAKQQVEVENWRDFTY